MSEPQNEDVEILPPSPDQIALAIIQGFASSGKFEDPEALVGQAWAAVPHFYVWRQKYAEQIAPMFFVPIDAGVGAGVADPDFEAQLATARLGVSSDPDADAY